MPVFTRMAIYASALMFMMISGKWTEAQVHHVVGDDRGWDILSNIPSWSAGRTFQVGDSLWFAYAAAEESIAELKSKEEFETCNVSNPVRMYTDGLDRIPLDGEGIRYFASSNPESCKEGLKLHMEVLPHHQNVENHRVGSGNNTAEGSRSAVVVADGPMTPSASSDHLIRYYNMVFWIGLCLCCMAL